jgi:hypothetical protein
MPRIAVFVRVLRDVPHFTISLLRSNVNGFYTVSASFLPVSSVFVRFWPKTGHFRAFPRPAACGGRVAAPDHPTLHCGETRCEPAATASAHGCARCCRDCPRCLLPRLSMHAAAQLKPDSRRAAQGRLGTRATQRADQSPHALSCGPAAKICNSAGTPGLSRSGRAQRMDTMSVDGAFSYLIASFQTRWRRMGRRFTRRVLVRVALPIRRHTHDSVCDHWDRLAKPASARSSRGGCPSRRTIHVVRRSEFVNSLGCGVDCVHDLWDQLLLEVAAGDAGHDRAAQIHEGAHDLR